MFFSASYNTDKFDVSSLHERAAKTKESMVDDGSGQVKVSTSRLA